jgi:tetratricopeptide (TPR) repeat protein
VDSAGPWQTLQLHLKSARAARDAGDVQLALKEVDAALAIDPDYLAARVLRDSIASPPPTPPQPQQAEQPQQSQQPVQVTVSQPERQPPDIPAARVSSLEERTRRRRIEQRIGAARTAIVLGRFAEAGAALDELNELDPALPVVPVLAAELRAARAGGKRRRLMLLVGVAAGLAGAVAGTLAGRAAQVNRELSSAAPITQGRFVDATAAPLVARATPMFSGGVPDVPSTLTPKLFEAPPAASAAEDAVATRVAPVSDPLPPPAPPIRPRAPVEAPARVAERVPAAAVPAERVSAAVERVSAPPVPTERAVEAPSPATPHFDPPSASSPALAVDDSALIRDALQRYRRAYNALDARLAHAVYPGVDETALTRAFEGLQSQSLDFEACTVDPIGMSARAVCRGSARYVPRIGSRVPRAESRVWTFRLRKDDGDWTIESAWTNR